MTPTIRELETLIDALQRRVQRLREAATQTRDQIETDSESQRIAFAIAGRLHPKADEIRREYRAGVQISTLFIKYHTSFTRIKQIVAGCVRQRLPRAVPLKERDALELLRIRYRFACGEASTKLALEYGLNPGVVIRLVYGKSRPDLPLIPWTAGNRCGHKRRPTDAGIATWEQAVADLV